MIYGMAANLAAIFFACPEHWNPGFGSEMSILTADDKAFGCTSASDYPYLGS
jgi:hypothetical protein|tara:strand:+ start:28343 stop:28498 length:156 start_codon:yes stop_codon:yes gene_type:complete